MTSIGIKADLTTLQRGFLAFQAKQAPFAIALTLTSLAKGAQAEEVKAIDATFDSPTPFTEKSIAVRPATKSRPVATVFAKDIAAAYLAPYVVGGDRFLGEKRGMLAPRGVGLNQYGNLSKGKLASLKSKPGVFIGPVHTKSGRVINGVWQRPRPARGARRAKGGTPAPNGGLKLLIQFEDTTPTQKHLPFYERAQAYVRRNAAREFNKALRIALATAKR